MVQRATSGARGGPRPAAALLRALAVAVVAVVAGAATTFPAGAAPPAHAHAATTALTTAGPSPDPTTSMRGADPARTNWYPNETTLNPQLVQGGTFGQLFSTTVNGEVYGQPLVDDGQLLANTENNYAYGLDPVSGAVLWSRQFGSPPVASAIGCADLTPTMGITSTPVVDQATNTEYLVDAEYASGTSGPVDYFMHALDLTNNGAEKPGFPVQIKGTASNNPSIAFNGTYQLQRPGLLLMNGVVYVGFGAHCDVPTYQGWVVGVSEAGVLTTLWTTNPTVGVSGAGIWMAGGGLVSDGPGQILLATGNDASNTVPAPGTSPPASLGESVVRLAVQADGSLKATDFFEPYDATTLDQNDLDFGSGSPVALPSAYFGTPTLPHLAVEVGKEGYVYLLNRDSLGGYEQAPNADDLVVGRYGPNGGVWSSPAVWPGNGGWVYIPTASGSASAGGSAGLLDAYQYGVDGTGKPTLNLAGTSSDAFGFGSSAPVVTSSGTTAGSALMWTVWSPNGTGVGAQLRAYNPVPVGGKMQLVYSAPVGTASKFNPPGVANNRLYVGTRNGTVVGFGAPVASPVTAPATTFPPTVIGQASTLTLTLTASTASTVSSLKASGAFTLGTPSSPLPATLAAGGTMTVPVTFSPTTAGPVGGSLAIATPSAGTTVVSLSGSGEVNGPSLISSTVGVSFGGIPPGQVSSQSVSFTNDGSQPLSVSSVTSPSAPFTVSGAPAAGAVLQPGATVVVSLGFAPVVNGAYADEFTVASNGGTVTVAVTGNADAPAFMSVAPLSVQFGPVPVGTSVTKTFTLTNTGGTNLTITKSKPPVLGPFTATTALAEGSTIIPGGSLQEAVTFTPGAVGTANDGWVITADDGQGVRTVQLSGTGILGDPGATGWARNGAAALNASNQVQLTPATPGTTGSTFAPVPVAADGLTVAFTSTIGGSLSGGDGTALVLANPATAASALGAGATGHGFSGIGGIAVVLSTIKGAGAPSKNFIGISDGPLSTNPAVLHWIATSTKVPHLHAAVAVRVTLAGGILSVSANGKQVLSIPITVGPNVRLGFTASTGAIADTQTVSGVSIGAQGPVTTVGDPTAGGWVLNGSSALASGGLQLTQTAPVNQAGTAYWPTPLSSSNLRATFTTSIGGGGTSGADGMALVLADPSTAPTTVGAPGGGLGFSGVHGVAVAIDTATGPTNPSANFVGVTDGPVSPAAPGQLHWLATDTAVASLRTTHTFTVTLVGGTLTVTMDGAVLLASPVTVGPNVLLGFSAATDTSTDTHAVSNVAVSAGARTSVAFGDPTAGGWHLNGSAQVVGGVTQLTQTSPWFQAGTAFWPTPVSAQGLTASFTTTIGGNAVQGADGMALVLAAPTTLPTAVGFYGGGLGFSGISGICVALDTYQNASNPSNNFIGVADGPISSSSPDQLHWLSTADVVPTLRATHTFTVALVDGTLTVDMDGLQVLSMAVNLGPQVLVGFSGGTGSVTDVHSVGTVAVTAS